MSSIHEDQRVGVFLDVQNMYYSAMQIYDRKVDFQKILKESVGNRKLVRAFAYVIKADLDDEQGFFDALEKIGFETRIKDLQVFYGGKKKGDWDVGIAMDAVRMTPKLDVAVIVSGDGDFIDLVQYLRGHGCRVEVMSFKKTASAMLIDSADHFYDMDADKTFLRKKRNPRKRTGTRKTSTRKKTAGKTSKKSSKTGRKAGKKTSRQSKKK